MWTDDMKKGKELVRFEIPKLGSFGISYDIFKYSEPFAHFNKKEKKEWIREHNARPKCTVWHNGCGIGSCNSIKEGLIVIKNYAEELLKNKIKETIICLSALHQVKSVTKNPDWIDKFQTFPKEKLLIFREVIRCIILKN